MALAPKVAIVYLSFHSEPYLDDVVSALKKITYAKDLVELVIVDNPHPIFGSSVRFIEETIMPFSGKELPHVTLLPQEKNLGFSGGNNAGMNWAIQHGFDYVYLHNDDGFVAASFLEPLVEAMEADPSIGAAQSLVMLYPETNLINTSGNSFHYLGIGYCNNFRVRKDDVKLTPIAATSYASGAAVLLRTSFLKDYGLWDEDFFLYHEDIEYSLRLKSVGKRIVTVTSSVFYHKYTFGRNAEKLYYIERNRLGVLLMFYKWPTLLLLVPIALFWEFGVVIFALRTGWLRTKLRTYGYWLSFQHWGRWLQKRAHIQKRRTVSDRRLLHDAVSRVTFNEASIDNPMLRYVGNPLMAAYWAIVQHFIFW
ncbi:MAG: glycosyltransferase family 2 protein [Candidatus Magasanikbacteria bacterium]|nr:glycosyltransferase family 2 protein [Candidatus Magasanikbacteria bacterium]